MQYTFGGTLCGRLCADVEESLTNATVLLYQPTEQAREQFLDEPVETFTVLSGADVQEKSDRLIAKTKVDANGEFSIEFDGAERGYNSGLIQVDVRIEGVRGQDPEQTDPVQIAVVTKRPEWEKSPEGSKAQWDYCFSQKKWCYVRSLFGAWVICGRVTTCSPRTGEPTDKPVSDVTVTAFDADIIEDESVGSAVTDSNGQYLIFYSTSDFERTPIPWFDVELDHGPDLYYEVSAGGSTLLEEDRSAGRTPGREDVRNCHHEQDLCISPPEDDPLDPGSPKAFWTGVGSGFTVPSDFDDEGYATSGSTEYALTGNVQFTGDATVSGLGGNPVEYRFLVSETTDSNAAPDLGWGDFDPSQGNVGAIGATGNEELFASSVLGKVLVNAPALGHPKWVTVRSSLGDLDGEGWLNVRDAIDRELQGDPDVGVGLAGATVYAWDDRDQLMGLHTEALAPAAAEPTLSGAGDSVDPGEKYPIEKVAIRFETKNVPSVPVGGDETTLNSMVLDNNRTVKELELDSDPCNATSGTVEVGYTAYHPHLGRAWITLQKGDDWRHKIEDDNADVTKVEVDIDVSDPSDPASTDQVYNPHFEITSELDQNEGCAYIVQFHERRRLHTGYNWVDRTHSMAIPFYYEP